MKPFVIKSLIGLPLLVSTTVSVAETPTSLSPVVVTATRTAQSVDETLASVTVITREEIERKQATSVPDLLRGIAGVSFAINGGPGQNSSLFLRGAESDQVTVLIDGVKIGSATVGLAPFQNLPVETIERIEIVRGPQSSLYGSEAIGGVIQIFTRRGGGEITPFFSVGGGADDTWTATAGVSGGGDNGWFNVTATTLDTDAFNACDGSFTAGCFTIEPDEDGYDNTSIQARGGYRFSNQLEAELFALRSRGDHEFDGVFSNESSYMSRLLGGKVIFSPSEWWQLTLNGGRSWDNSVNFKDGIRSSHFKTRRDSVSLQNDLTLTDSGLLTVGADYQNDEINSSNAYTEDTRDNTGLFAQYQHRGTRFDGRVAVRHDDNEQFGNQTTGSVAVGIKLTSALRVTASHGTAFKAPTFNELYFPLFGNPNLDPEESSSTELGLYGKHEAANWSLNLFRTRIEELISFDAVTFTPVNVDDARILGLEAALSTNIKGWAVATNLTFLDPENRSRGANNGNVLPRRARQSLRIDLDKTAGRFSYGSTLIAANKRYDDLANNQTLGGFVTVDLRGEYQLSEQWRLQARVENLLDKDYETADRFNQPERGLYLTLRYQP